MTAVFQNFLKWLDNLGANFHSTDVEKRNTTILIRASFLTGFFMILYIGNCIYIGFDLGLTILPFESLIFFSIPFLIKHGLQPKIAAHLYIANGTAFGILLVWFSGGLQSPVTPWLTLMPICAILFLNARNAWIWAFIILGVVMVMGMYWLFADAFPKNYNQRNDPLFFLNCYAGLIFIYLLLSLIFEKRLNATIKELETSKLSLEESNYQLNLSLNKLKKTQAQLVQSEKLASLGELSAGIAHEIQNPLNFVNNFSEINKELLKELVGELEKGKLEDVKTIISDLISNEEKIKHHGSRAESIVKGMLQHSNSGTGKKEPTNINALADEYLRLSYHGFRVKDKTFNARIKTEFDDTIGNINVVPQDIARLILNLITNAFYAVNEKRKQNILGYEPTVSVNVKKNGSKVIIDVKDNGNGIPNKILDKIFQPFFTTKPTGQGTGLGLSLSYDIVKAHGGEIKVNTEENEGTEFTIILPV